MFRVPLDTVLRRASVASLLVLATALSACGDDTPATGDTSSGQSALSAPGGDVSQAPAGSTPATTPKETTPTKTTKSESGPDKDVKPLEGTPTEDEVPGGIKAKEFSPADQKKITDHFENAASIAAQPDDQYTQAQINAQMTAVIKAAKAAGVTLEKKDPGEARNMGKLESDDNITIMFFPSYRRATEVTRNYQQLISTRPGFGRADHFKTRMWIITDEDGIKQKDLVAYRKVRARVEGEV